jgi:tetratricopeptide (TPR) repeat protein
VGEAARDKLRVLLHRAALSPERFAHQLNGRAVQMGLTARLDRKTPYKWLRGSSPRDPWPWLAATIFSEHLGTEITPEDIGWPTGRAGVIVVGANSGLDMPWTGAGSIGAAIEIAEANMLDRRIFLQITGATLTQPALQWLIAQPANDVASTIGRRVNDAHVDSIEAITGQLQRMDDQFGGGAVLDLAKSQLRFVVDLLRNRSYSSAVGTRLHGAAAELLRLGGWLSHDAGQDAQAQRFWLAALRGAHAAGDRALGANILGFMANQAKHLDLNSEAIHLAEAARQGYSGASPRVSAILSLRVAESHANIGDTTQCRAGIDAAYDSLRNTSSDSGDPAWSYWLDEAQVNGQAGYCYTRLGDWSRAQSHLTTALRLQGDSYRREGALRRGLLAITYASQGDPEHACEVANTAVDMLADDVDSPRCLGRVRQVQTMLHPYRKVAAVRDFHERTNQLFGTPA